MRHSTCTPTAAEVARFELSKEGPCMACVVRMATGLLPQQLVVVGCDYNHCKSGNRRRGHLFGYALCVWHHRAHPMPRQTTSSTRDRYGPSLMDGSALFHETYGSDDELIALQTEWIERQLVMA
ncbi:Ref family recombination enhancement nuclease [Xanthomonas perforans]|uniref:Ref family recombination enhancement nuclease n=1 Tax=Xanthomonas perforans TaxID=442694 RepID=UPI000D69F043|nr:Ref family recombination enhancement nuclease [Xanthomonas perforans]PWH21647.1 hypothetical protein CDO09_20035 [Xanthomonas perforans]